MYRQMSCLLLAASCVVVFVAADLASDVAHTTNERIGQAVANNQGLNNNQGTPGAGNNGGTVLVSSNSNNPGPVSSSVSQSCIMVDGKPQCTTEMRNNTGNGVSSAVVVNSQVSAAGTSAPVATVEVKQEVKPAATPAPTPPPTVKVPGNSASNVLVSCGLTALLAVLARLA